MNKRIESITYPIQKALGSGGLYQCMSWPIQDAFHCRLHSRMKRFIMNPRDYVTDRMWFVDLCDMLCDGDEEVAASDD